MVPVKTIRPWRIAAAGALAAGGIGLLCMAAARGNFAGMVGWTPGSALQLAHLFGWSCALCFALLLAFPRVAHRWISAALFAWTVVAFGPGPAASVALLALAAAVIGSRMLRSCGIDHAEPLVALSAGLVAISAVIGATSAIKWHWPAPYALAIAGCLYAFRIELRPLAAAGGTWWAARTPREAKATYIPIALLAATLAVHIAVAAKPEVGHDALAMHLQIAAEMAHGHRFRNDVATHIWAVMPLGADWLYASAYQFGGEAAARLSNLGAFLILLAWLARLTSTAAATSPAVAAAAAGLFASMPLAFAETSTLYVENYWSLQLLAATAAGERAFRERDARWAIVCVWFAAGSLQAKVIGVFWVLPLLAAVAWRLRDRWRTIDGRQIIAIIAALAVMAWPYLNALWRTGNPVFPFMNAIFRSPYFESAVSFNNALYNAPLTWRTWYDVVVDSGQFLEGAGGALGLHWLMLFPAVFLLARRAQLGTDALLLILVGLFCAATWLQQSYLRYLYPAFALLLALGGRILVPLPERRMAFPLAMLLPIVAINLYLMPAGGWWNSSFCVGCGFDADARMRYIDRYADQRNVVEWLNANAPSAQVGWLRQYGVGPAGFWGPIWMVSWHDYRTTLDLRAVTNADELAIYARRRGTSLFVLPRFDGASPFEQIVAAFRDAYTTPVLMSGTTILARWADTADRRVLALPGDFETAGRNNGVTRDGSAVRFAPSGLLWTEATLDSGLLTYHLVAACRRSSGRGVVEVVWLDGDGQSLRTDTHYHGCSEDGRVADGGFVMPAGARRVRIYVGSAAGAPFALASFIVSTR